MNNNIYGDKLVILMDHPSTQRQGSVDDFKRKYKALCQNNQIFILDKRDVEQTYPDQIDETYGNWKKSQQEVDEMDGRKKIQLAKKVGDTISQEQFETEMQICFNALKRCWELSFHKI